MRTSLLLFALAFNMCTTANVAEKTEGGAVEIQTLTTGGYAIDEERKAVLVTSQEEYERQWQALIGEGSLVSADFEKSVVVFLLGGMHNTGGWSVVPESALLEGDTIVINARVQGPSPGVITTQAITYPYAVVAVHTREAKNVRWDPQ